MLRHQIEKFIRDRVAQDLIEYTLLLAFVALGVIGLFSQTGNTLSGLWTSANSTIALGAVSSSGGGAGAPATGGAGGNNGSGSGDQNGGDGH